MRAANWTPEQHLSGLASDPRAAIAGRTPLELFSTGLPLCQALKADGRATRVLLLAELARTWKAVKVGDAKTWDSQEALQDAVDDVLEIFPTLKVEEVLQALKDIRQGRAKLFGRLDTPTLLEVLRNYEDRHTTTFREQQHHKPPTVETAAWEHRPAGPGTIPVSEALARIKAMLPTRRKTLEELGGHVHLTAEDLKAIQEHEQSQNENPDPQTAAQSAGPNTQPVRPAPGQ